MTQPKSVLMTRFERGLRINIGRWRHAGVHDPAAKRKCREAEKRLERYLSHLETVDLG